MTNFAYLRVSTNQQDTENQKLSVLDYCNRHHLVPVHYIEDTSSGKLPWQSRPIGNILEKANSDDHIIVAEVSRLGRSTLQVLEILEHAATQQVSVHIAKSNMMLDGSMQSTITATILGLAAQIEREFIATRTKEALSQRKAKGIKLGRPTGQATILKLDIEREHIIQYLKKGVSKRSIARIIECSPATLYTWLKRRNIKWSLLSVTFLFFVSPAYLFFAPPTPFASPLPPHKSTPEDRNDLSSSVRRSDNYHYHAFYRFSISKRKALLFTSNVMAC